MPASPDLAIVMPVYNEATTIDRIVSEWFAMLRSQPLTFVFIAINDGSRDQSPLILRQLQEKLGPELVVYNRQNNGHGRACRYGYEEALSSRADWILQIDSDGQCLPEYFPEFWHAREEADVVFGIRRGRGDGFSRVVISQLCRLAAGLVTGTWMKDPNVPYRLINRTALAATLRRIPASIDMQNMAMSLALSRNPSLRWKRIRIRFPNRRGGANSIHFSSIFWMGLRMLLDLWRVEK